MKTPHLLLALPLLAVLVGCHREDSPAIRARAAAVGVHPLITSIDLAGRDLALADLTPPPDLLPTQIPLQQPQNGTCLRQQWLLFSDGTVRAGGFNDIWFDACRGFYCTLAAGHCAPKAYQVFFTDSSCTIPRVILTSGDDGLSMNPLSGGLAKFIGGDGRYYTRGSISTKPAAGATVYYRTPMGGVCTAFKYVQMGDVYAATVVASPATGPVSYLSTYDQTP